MIGMKDKLVMNIGFGVARVRGFYSGFSRSLLNFALILVFGCGALLSFKYRLPDFVTAGFAVLTVLVMLVDMFLDIEKSRSEKKYIAYVKNMLVFSVLLMLVLLVILAGLFKLLEMFI